MTTGMLHLHSIIRYIILIVALWAVIKMAMGLNGKKPFTKTDKRPALFFLIVMDLQLLVGLYLYFFGNYGFHYFRDNAFGDVMKNNVARFFAIEHIFGMIIAVILVHIGYAATKKNIADKKKFKHAFTYFLIAIIIILICIPWPFRHELGRGWMPG